METKKCIFFFLVIILMIFFLISFATKSSHWEQINDKSLMLSELPHVYRSLEGLITMDVFLFILCIATVGFFNTNHINVLKIIIILWILLIFIRFILGILFLAGENSYCKREIEYWDNLPQSMKDYLGNDSFYESLKGAWVFEIICNIFVYVMTVVLMAIWWKYSRQN